MKLDATITISIILAICALFAPSITALINNRHQYKMRKLELEYDFKSQHSSITYKNKYDTYKAFLDSAGDYSLMHDYAGNYIKMLSCSQNALLLCDSETKPFLLKFIKGLDENMTSDSHEYKILLSGIAESFNRELSSLSSEYNN
ncbi:hypothetical protein [Sellimonas caecigallum]|uniref:Uncharacterized protein n=1 Tax=Sellimonas caecigallum TaxID=2592333 RepID=A0ABS7L663_9FIRM|nr:hypothetical protein [Sellimonas caecigallum]MBY0758556.1 hypothetical protein [Sellimonas caecigallum]